MLNTAGSTIKATGKKLWWKYSLTAVSIAANTSSSLFCLIASHSEISVVSLGVTRNTAFLPNIPSRLAFRLTNNIEPYKMNVQNMYWHNLQNEILPIYVIKSFAIGAKKNSIVGIINHVG